MSKKPYTLLLVGEILIIKTEVIMDYFEGIINGYYNVDQLGKICLFVSQ